jgi:hypothetical protein
LKLHLPFGTDRGTARPVRKNGKPNDKKDNADYAYTVRLFVRGRDKKNIRNIPEINRLE